MLSSRFRSLAILAAFAIGAACAFASHASDVIVASYRAARDWTRDTFLTIASLAGTPAGQVAKQPERMLRVAEQKQAAQDKRQRPRIENSWRMCPSV